MDAVCVNVEKFCLNGYLSRPLFEVVDLRVIASVLNDVAPSARDEGPARGVATILRLYSRYLQDDSDLVDTFEQDSNADKSAYETLRDAQLARFE